MSDLLTYRQPEHNLADKSIQVPVVSESVIAYMLEQHRRFDPDAKITDERGITSVISYSKRSGEIMGAQNITVERINHLGQTITATFTEHGGQLKSLVIDGDQM